MLAGSEDVTGSGVVADGRLGVCGSESWGSGGVGGMGGSPALPDMGCCVCGCVCSCVASCGCIGLSPRVSSGRSRSDCAPSLVDEPAPPTFIAEVAVPLSSGTRVASARVAERVMTLRPGVGAVRVLIAERALSAGDDGREAGTPVAAVAAALMAGLHLARQGRIMRRWQLPHTCACA